MERAVSHSRGRHGAVRLLPRASGLRGRPRRPPRARRASSRHPNAGASRASLHRGLGAIYPSGFSYGRRDNFSTLRDPPPSVESSPQRPGGRTTPRSASATLRGDHRMNLWLRQRRYGPKNSVGIGREAADSALSFSRAAFRPQTTADTADNAMMKVLAHLSPTVLAVLAAALGITLSVFLLSGAGAQGEPAPLLAVISGAAGRVAADLPAAVHACFKTDRRGRLLHAARNYPIRTSRANRGRLQRHRCAGDTAALGAAPCGAPPSLTLRVGPPLQQRRSRRTAMATDTPTR